MRTAGSQVAVIDAVSVALSVVQIFLLKEPRHPTELESVL
jgi:hypothetical protein